MDDDHRCPTKAQADLHLYILFEAACFDRRFSFSTGRIHHPRFVAGRDKLLRCAFLETSSAKQESMDGPFCARARPRQDSSLLKENPSRKTREELIASETVSRVQFSKSLMLDGRQYHTATRTNKGAEGTLKRWLSRSETHW